MHRQSHAFSRPLTIVMVVVLVGFAAAALYAVKTSHDLRSQLERKESENQQLRATKTVGAEVGMLEKQLREMETAYNRLQAEIQQIKSLAASATAAPKATPAVTNAAAVIATNRLSWLERTRQEDPARFKQITEAREQRRQQMETYLQDQFTRLDERLKTAKTQEEADLVTQLSVTLQRVDELRQKWDSLRQLPDEERQTQVQELATESRQTYQTLTQLRTQDRQMQLAQFANQVGYREPKDVQAFVDSLQRIYTETDTSLNRAFGGRGQPAR
jgi:DNA repair exonuclease SbcCD ATPase subunit